MQEISIKKEYICVGDINDIINFLEENKRYIYSIDIELKERLTAYDLSNPPKYRCRFILKRELI